MRALNTPYADVAEFALPMDEPAKRFDDKNEERRTLVEDSVQDIVLSSRVNQEVFHQTMAPAPSNAAKEKPSTHSNFLKTLEYLGFGMAAGAAVFGTVYAFRKCFLKSDPDRANRQEESALYSVEMSQASDGMGDVQNGRHSRGAVEERPAFA